MGERDLSGAVNCLEYTVIPTRRKTIALQFTPEGKLLVRCPIGTGPERIRRLVEEKRGWIQKQQQRLQNREQLPKLTQQELENLKKQAQTILSERVAWFAPRLGVDYGKITIRSQRTRWGSCTGAGNLSFNCLLLLTPSQVLDYVVVHELCHRIHMNHSSAFWASVEACVPDYRQCRRWLKDHGGSLICRLDTVQ